MMPRFEVLLASACAAMWTIPSPPHTTRLSTPSATQARAMSSASSPSRPLRWRTTKPASRNLGKAIDAEREPLPLPAEGFVNSTISLATRREYANPLARRVRVSLPHRSEPDRGEHTIRCDADGLRETGQRLQDPVRGELGSRNGQGEAAVVLQEQDLSVRPELVSFPAPILIEDRLRESLVRGQEVTVQRAIAGVEPATDLVLPTNARLRRPGELRGPEPVRQVERVDRGHALARDHSVVLFTQVRTSDVTVVGIVER